MATEGSDSIVTADQPGRQIGQKIVLWGGGGKTTLSRALGENLGLPIVEMDALHWLPGWKERDPDEFRKLMSDTLAGLPDGWIADGQYIGILHGDVLERADTLIWVDLPFRVIFWRVFKRSVKRARDRQVICGNNVESWRQSFLSRDSLLLFLLNRRLFRHRASIERRESLIRERGPDVTVVRLRSARALDRFYEEHGLVRPPD